MGTYQKELSHIKGILRENPRGMTVTEISKEIHINRNSVAKYLDILLVSGHVEMRTVGPAKVYYLSQRVPISSMLNFSSDYILVLDRELRIVQINDNLLETFDVERGTVLGSQLEKTSLPFSDDSGALENIAGAVRGEEFSGEISFRVGDSELVFRVKMIPTTFDDGSLGATIIFENITRQKRAEEALRENEARYRRLMETANDAIFLADEGIGVIVDCNEKAGELLGKTREDIIGMHNAQIVLESEEESSKRVLEQGTEGGNIVVMEDHFITRSDGTKVWVDVTTSKYDAGDRSFIQAIFHDISERKKVKEALLEREERFKELTDLLPQTAFEVDAHGKLTFSGRYGPGSQGFSRDDIEDCPDALQRFVPGDREKLEQNIRNLLQGLEPGGLRYTALRKDGSTFPALVYVSPVVEEGEDEDDIVGLRGVVLDIGGEK